MANPSPDWALLDRFLAGECAPADAERVRGWLDENVGSAIAVDALRMAIHGRVPPEPMPAIWDVEQAWSRVDRVTRDDSGGRYRLPSPLRRVDGAKPSNLDRTSVRIGRMLRPAASPWFRAAAALVLVGGGVATAVLWRANSRGVHAAAVAPRIITTQRSERADLRLADGTHVILAPESRLTIPADFGVARRELALVGEGYFDVTHNSAKPFRVLAAHGIVHDLGTRFSVRMYPSDSAVQVVVAEGRVVVGPAGSASLPRGPILQAGDLARLDRAGAAILARGVDIDRYQSWINGRLRFSATPLREVLLELTRWYNVDFNLADSTVGDRRVTIVIGDEPLTQILSTIALIARARYDRSGGFIRFSALPETLRAPGKS